MQAIRPAPRPLIMATYNGWANYETWNVSLWIGNDPGYYSLAQDADNIDDFLDVVAANGHTHTPDGVEFDGPKLDYSRLNLLIQSIY